MIPKSGNRFSEKIILSGFFKLRIAGLVLGLAAFAIAPGRAEDYPSRPIRILSPYAPGGISDIAARIVGGKMAEDWGQQIVVENRPGANGFIAMEVAAHAAADGYTLVLCTVGDVAINPALFKDIPYDFDRDFEPITSVSDAPMVLATHGASPYKSVADVIAAAIARPDAIGVATPGYGSMNHLVLESIQVNTGAKFVHVPYKGGAPAAQALVAGDIPLGIIASSSAAPHLSDGSIRVLAVTTGQRTPLNPDWPTLREVGAGNVAMSNWTMLLAPKRTPQPILDKLDAEVVDILNTNDVKQRFAGGGVTTTASTAAQLAARVGREAAIYRLIVEKTHVHVD